MSLSPGENCIKRIIQFRHMGKINHNVIAVALSWCHSSGQCQHSHSGTLCTFEIHLRLTRCWGLLLSFQFVTAMKDWVCYSRMYYFNPKWRTRKQRKTDQSSRGHHLVLQHYSQENNMTVAQLFMLGGLVTTIPDMKQSWCVFICKVNSLCADCIVRRRMFL